MHRILLIVPSLLDAKGESILDPAPPTLREMTGRGTLVRLNPLPETETPEALYLGMAPSEGQLRQGPLTVSALGADPPTGSTHFHLSLMSHDDGIGKEIELKIPPEEERKLLAEFPRLNGKALTLVAGHGVDHGLVWEKRGDMGTTPARDLSGKAIKDHLPEGDGEAMLRRLIDDSINLLSELELNVIRLDQGLPPVNMLWPWGQGLRTEVPNLALRRGERADVVSTSLRLQGLTRLTGYRHLDARALGKDLNLRLEQFLTYAKTSDPIILVIETVERLRQEARLEEMAWFLRELDDRLLAPLVKNVGEVPTRIALFSPGESGLGLTWESGKDTQSIYPFDERALDERAIPRQSLHESVAKALDPAKMAG